MIEEPFINHKFVETEQHKEINLLNEETPILIVDSDNPLKDSLTQENLELRCEDVCKMEYKKLDIEPDAPIGIVE